MDRRNFMRLGSAASVALLANPERVLGQEGERRAPIAPPRARPAARGPGGQPAVITPNGRTLPLRDVGAVRVGHLVAEELEHEFAPGLRVRAWGYNGSTPGPTIEATEGERVRLYVTNRLPEPTSVHWHGIVLPNGMDGVSALNQPPIPPGETCTYEFDLRYPGTFMYHSHYDEMTQIALGCVGMFVVHPRRPRGARVDRDFVLMTHEWTVDVGTSRPDPNAMEGFNVLT
jgi:FtsP/CotA-like multicopper oxidase with cupredoxin domain